MHEYVVQCAPFLLPPIYSPPLSQRSAAPHESSRGREGGKEDGREDGAIVFRNSIYPPDTPLHSTLLSPSLSALPLLLPFPSPPLPFLPSFLIFFGGRRLRNVKNEAGDAGESYSHPRATKPLSRVRTPAPLMEKTLASKVA